MKRLMSFILLLVLAISSITSVYAQRQDGIRPSFKQGYARSAGESKHPQLWRGLASAWVPALGVTGNTLHDVSTFNNHGTLTNMDAGTDWIIGQAGYALDYAGDDDYVDCGSLPKFPKFTIIAYLDSPKVQNSFAGVAFGGTSNTGWGIYITATDIIARISTDSAFDDWTVENYNETNYPAGLHQVVLTNDGTSMRFYRDGKFIDVHTNTEVQGGSDVGFSIGRFGIFENIESYFQGEIGNVLLYNRVLLANEIAWLHRNPLAMFELRE